MVREPETTAETQGDGADEVTAGELPVSHTGRPGEKLWERLEAYWLRLTLEGVPAGFGKKDTPEL